MSKDLVLRFRSSGSWHRGLPVYHFISLQVWDKLSTNSWSFYVRWNLIICAKYIRNETKDFFSILRSCFCLSLFFCSFLQQYFLSICKVSKLIFVFIFKAIFFPVRVKFQGQIKVTFTGRGETVVWEKLSSPFV